MVPVVAQNRLNMDRATCTPDATNPVCSLPVGLSQRRESSLVLTSKWLSTRSSVIHFRSPSISSPADFNIDFSKIAHDHGFCPQPHLVVSCLPLQADIGGPSSISFAHSFAVPPFNVQRAYGALSLRQIHEKPARDAGFFLDKSYLRHFATTSLANFFELPVAGGPTGFVHFKERRAIALGVGLHRFRLLIA